MSDEMVSAEKAREMGPQLAAAEAVRLRDTVIALHAIVEGRTTAPTDDELAAHAAAGGAWLARLYDGTLVVMRDEDGTFRVAGTEVDRG